MSGKRIESPLSQKTRPTSSKVREALINILGNKLRGASWLDLCSGSGAMACEALQKGVKRVLAIEKQRETAKICKKNLIDVSNTMDQSIHIEVICNELISFLKKGPKNQKIQFVKDCQNPEKFDFVFLDPPYESEVYEITQELLLSKEWIKESTTLICECSSKSMPRIHNGWKLNKEKFYGSTSLIFLIPNQA
ncbi:MAG: 16S rRNA (guanine(966)-N(2))-methyltransferase RsmD [Prochlorococcus sp. MED-G73]|jgi:16S rRNA (guanine966-N2)-methyltransferase|uniref:16S rRNA (guanine(966)-N(2))-methyltransferase RsmD n=1 Tax=Prochlorococcus marinus TaxID=1219 RepID=UPI000D905005|nr:16S rRNA (guanine(966)-N(2))-methyltransferase RsmD [Prochlorococcus marinus]MBW3049749.1 16S rRNA (guanine(966)-N(2))-methyltransferase RsmD [Prochlorococcus marinus str. MU1403]PYE01563.1 16S rRNA (guanine(966)-N(2))-methyltransferase RsmD [Prochlorococcus marinus XMU1403]RCL49712.1 MAG: 16S rRNA (guanine(966)-N(2))-methyltransferase RsmD [Prochlorococcus sp. MED-G73]|tara:strand:- start:543 stop:1121 length:579 start_codon:yes stop_codon:yes gene_type:complete